MDYKISDSKIREIPRAFRAAENSRYATGKQRNVFVDSRRGGGGRLNGSRSTSPAAW